MTDIFVIKGTPADALAPDHFFIGGNSPDNPFILRPQTGDLFEDIISYDEWLDDGIKGQWDEVVHVVDTIGVPLLEGRSVTLVCDCCPTGGYRTCHGSILRNHIKQLLLNQ